MVVTTGKFELVPPVGEHETPESFLSRLAAYNELDSVHDLFRLVGEPSVGPNVAGRFERIAAMACVTGARFYGLSAGIKNYHMLEGHPIKQSQTCRKLPRYCPVCVSEDISKGVGPIGARTWQRFWWQWTVIETCCTHGCDLRTGQQTIRSLTPDFAQYVASNTRLIKEEAASARRGLPRPFDSYMHSRLLGISPVSRTFLDSLPLSGATLFCAALGALLGGVKHLPQSSVSEGKLRSNGFELVLQGSQKMFSVLHQQALDNVNGLNKRAKYGCVYTLLSSHRDDPEWRSIVELFRRDGLDTLPLDKGDDFLGEILTARRVHSVYTINVQYKVHPTTVVKILEHFKLLPKGLVHNKFNMTTVPAERADAVFDQVKQTVTTPGASSRLGLNLVLLQRFRKEGFLSLADTGAVYTGAQPRYTLTAIEQLLGEIESLEAVPDVTGDYRPFVNVAKWGRIVATAAWSLVREGKVRAIRKEDGRGFLGVYLHHHDLLTARPCPQIEHAGMSKREVARVLRTSEPTVDRLRDCGVLTGRKMVKNWEEHLTFSFDRDSVEEFPRHFASIMTLAKEAGCSTNRLLPALERSGIAPVFEPLRPKKPNSTEARIYRRSDVMAFLRSWVNETQ